MFQANILLVIIVATSGAPSPYYTSSLIETPTSRVESHLLLSAPSHDSYKFQPHHVIPQSSFNNANVQPLASRVVSKLNVDVPKLPALKSQLEQRFQPAIQSSEVMKMQPENEIIKPAEQQPNNLKSDNRLLNVPSTTETLLPKVELPKQSQTMQQIKQESYEIFRPKPLPLIVDQIDSAPPTINKSEETKIESEMTPQIMNQMNLELRKESIAKSQPVQTLKDESQENLNSIQSQMKSNRIQAKSYDGHTQVFLPQPQVYSAPLQTYLAQPQAYSAQRQYALPRPYFQQAHLSTSHPGSHLSFSPQSHGFYGIPPHAIHYQPQAYNVQPHRLVSQAPNLLTSKQQLVYYHPHQQQLHHVQQPVNLYDLRQEVPWWQDLYNQYNQFVGQGQEGSQEGSQEGTQEGSQEGSQVNVETRIEAFQGNEESVAEESPEQIKKKIDLELVQTTLAPRFDSVEIYSSEETTKDIKLDDLGTTTTTTTTTSTPDAASEEEDFSELFTETSSTLGPQNDNDESVIADHKYDADLITTNLSPNDKLDKNQKEEDENLCEHHARQVKAPLHKLYSFNDQYYVLSGSPKFYGNIDSRSLMLSLQQLLPVMRNDDINDDEPQERKIASNSASTENPTSRLGKIIVQEEETKEKDNDEPVQKIAISKLPSERQSSAILENEAEESRDEKKEEQSSSQGRDLSDESSIAQAKPSAIAIAGNGGVASSKPVANAISGPNGLSVASPSATSVAGDFIFDNEDRKQKDKTQQP